ncbi:TonB C-terminal domain-containing protein [Burkholderia sp. Ac-20353]|uniref:TonB C-terminal domain-containing protein n=1 Tax=Burkholderia sp. Ac-20353 TaxID=2703894 RepID=UPI00197C9557|nr:TonB C-terminal domain-containing protein [Burkholderia sp. Ac-20353]MBN3789236.1 secretin and TonB N terminus short domain protein [Burkholderia sp. Ac-20353]
MTGSRASAGALALTTCVVLWGAVTIQRAHAQDAGGAPSRSVATLHFDLPAQSLGSALETYSRVTKTSVLVDNELLARRVSKPVTGEFSRSDALRRLLDGTGLSMNFTSENAAVIVGAPAAVEPATTSTSSGGSAVESIDGINGNVGYAIMVQARLTEALCASPETRPGNYRLVVQMRIDDSGAVSASKLVGSTGEPARDAAIGRAVRSLVLDSGPPTGLPQPVTILLRPIGGAVVSHCSLSGERG